jgi:hypothetical protein
MRTHRSAGIFLGAVLYEIKVHTNSKSKERAKQGNKSAF